MRLLKMLTQAASPSGNEDNVRAVIKREVTPLADDVYEDKAGNLIAHINGDGPRVLFDAHMDEVGIIVTYIEDSGLIRFSNLGGIDATNSIAQRVRFLNGTMGVIYKEQNQKTSVKMSDLYIDIGAENKEQAEEKINIGDVACFEGVFEQNGNRVVSKAMDDRVGCYVLIEAMKKIKASASIKNDLYFMFSVSEELGLRGARAGAPVLMPDFAVSVDVTRTGDLPGKLKMAVKLGEGPAVKVKDSSILCHPYIKSMMKTVCDEKNIPYQIEVLENGGTNVGAIHLTCGGVPSGCISIPTRYIHTPCEMADIRDIQGAVSMVENMVKKGFSL